MLDTPSGAARGAQNRVKRLGDDAKQRIRQVAGLSAGAVRKRCVHRQDAQNNYCPAAHDDLSIIVSIPGESLSLPPVKIVYLCDDTMAKARFLLGCELERAPGRKH
jgi:hypothetical protein